MANEKKLEESQKDMQVLINDIRKEVSCCCSWHRTRAVNKLLDEMQELHNGDKLWYDILNGGKDE